MKNHSSILAKYSSWSWLILCCLGLSSLGCQWTPKPKAWSWPWSNKDEAALIPDKIMPIWTDTILHQPGKPGVRGFGGRIFFYKEKSTDPIEVDGGLAVYVFDSDNFDPNLPQPEKKYVFTPDQFASHFSKSNMGPSYSIWVPWDQVGGPNQRLTLVVRFEGRNGGTIISDPTIKLLPGVMKASNDTKQNSGGKSSDSGPLRTASFTGNQETQPPSSPPTPPVTDTRRTETIDLPPSFQRHLLPQTRNFDRRNGLDRVGPSDNIPNTNASPNIEPSLGSSSSLQSSQRDPSVQLASFEAIAKPETVVYDAKTMPNWRRTGQGYNSRFKNSLKNPLSQSHASTENTTSDGSGSTSIQLTNNGPKDVPHEQDVLGNRTAQVPSRMFRDHPSVGGWIESLPRTPRR